MIWILRALPVLFLLGVAAGYVLIKTGVVSKFLCNAIAQQLDKVSRGRAQIGNLELQTWPLRAKFHNITVQGKQDRDQPPVLCVDTIEVYPRVWGLLHRKVDLSEVIITHPVLRAVVNAQGKATIPWLSPDRNATGNIIELSIRHLAVGDGEIAYVDKKTPLAANVYGFDIRIDFEDRASRYHASIAYQDGLLQYAHYAPLRHALSAKFSGDSSHILVESAVVSVGSSTASIHGELDIDKFSFDGHYQAHVHAQDFRSSLWPVAIAGDLQLVGRAHYQDIATRPWLVNVSIDGQIGSDKITVVTSDREIEFFKPHGHYQLANGALQLRDIVVELLGGQAGAEFTIDHLENKPKYRVEASLIGVDLSALQLALTNRRHRSVVLSGILDGTANASWTSNLNDAACAGDLHLHAATAKRTTSNLEHGLPVEGTIRFSYNRPRDAITFRKTSVRIGGFEIAMQGEASDHSNLKIHASASDVRQLSGLLSSVLSDDRNAMEISGSALLEATMHESLRAPNVSGNLTAHNLVLRGARWSNAKIDFDASPSNITVQNALFVSPSQGTLSLRGKVALSNWLYFPSNPLNVSILMARMPVADFQRVANVRYPVSGEVSADLSVHGSAVAPVGSGAVRIINVHIYDEPVTGIMLHLRAKDGSITTDIEVALAAGSATGTLIYTPQAGTYHLRMSAPAISLRELKALRVRDVSATAVLKMSITGQGTLSNPELIAVFEVPQVQFRDTTVSQLSGKVQIAYQRADLNFTSLVDNATVRLQGFANLNGHYYSEATLDTGTLQLHDLLAFYLADSAEAIEGQTELHATMKGPLKNIADLEAHVTVPRLEAKYKLLQVATTTPLQIDYAHSVIKLLPFKIHGTGTSVSVEGSLPLGEMPSLGLTAHGTLDTSVLSLLDQSLKSSGAVLFDLRSTGGLQNLSVQGQVHLQNVALSTADSPLAGENLNGSLEVVNNRVRISRISGQLGGGQLAITGWIECWPNPQYQLAMETSGVRLWYAGGVLMLLDGKLALAGNAGASALNGRILIEKVSFTPDFDLKKLVDHFGGSPPPHNADFTDSLKLAVAVQSKDKLSATSSQVRVEGNVNGQLIGTAARPVVIGRTDLTSGEVFFGKRRYQLQRAIAVFNDPNETRPTLDVSATTNVNQYHLTLTLRGPLDKLTTSYTSDPPLAVADIINLLVVGRTTQTAEVSGTDSIIASQLAGQFSSKVQTLTGISGLRIDPLVGGSNRDPSARIAFQQRVTKNFLFSFSTDISQPNGEMIQGEYQINRKWSIGATRDPVGGLSVMGRHRTTF